MIRTTRKPGRGAERVSRTRQLEAGGALPAIGLEAEFTTIVDGVPRTPEEVFGSPRNFIRGPLIHRTGRSYHLPTGGALYFDTGVMEIATPMIEIARGCGARGTRALWESLAFLRTELDAWEESTGRTVRLAGFSAHYNVSFDVPGHERANGRSVEELAYLLTHILAAPVMLLAANRRSTGVGVRPRGNRVEITADFTPDAGLMAATATLIVGIVRDVMSWHSYSLDEIQKRCIPLVDGFVPERHSSRKGWVAKHTCFPANPFTSDVNDRRWPQLGGGRRSLREMAGRTTRVFWDSIRALGDAMSLHRIADVMRGRAPSFLELDDRPAAYEDVGRLCTWDNLISDTRIRRSRYERVVAHAIAGRRLRIDGTWHRPVGMHGWTHVVFRREDGGRSVLSLDALLVHLGKWDRTANRRFAERRAAALIRHLADRRETERRDAAPIVAEERRATDGLIIADAPLTEEDLPAAPPISPSMPSKGLSEPRRDEPRP